MKKQWESAKIAIFFTDEADVIRTSVGGVALNGADGTFDGVGTEDIFD